MTRSDGHLFVAAGRSVISLDPHGDKLWAMECNPAGDLVLLSDERLIVAEQGPQGEERRLSVRDQRDGRLLATIPEWAHCPAVTAGGMVLYAYRRVRRDSELRAFDLDGRFHWSAPLKWPELFPPLVLEDSIVVLDGRTLKAFDYTGTPVWTACPEGFQEPGGQGPKGGELETSDSELNIQNAALPEDGKVLASFGADGFHVFDVGTRNVTPIDALLPRGHPGAFPNVEGHTYLITSLGTSFDLDGSPSGWLVGKHSLAGTCIWEHDTGAEPYLIIADRMGKAIIACSPTWARWEKRSWSPAARHAMLDECYIRCLSADGEELFTWYAETPFLSPLAVGAAGEIYVAARGRLWAIG